MSDPKDEIGIGRFPVPDKWILKRLPEELHGMFGFRGEMVPSEGYRDEIAYTYTVSLPDGVTVKKALLIHYLPDDGVVTAFIIGDTIVLDGIFFTVKDWESREVSAWGEERKYTHHEVNLTLAAPRG